MKNKFKIILFLILTLNSNNLYAGTLTDSLNSAYLNNPKLNAERANVRAVKEERKGALSEFKPSITISGYVSEQDNTKGSESNYKPSERSLLIEQKIFQGFGGIANLKKKDHEYSLAEFKLQKIEQEVLLDAVMAHADLLLSQKKVYINRINIDLLERQVETDRNRLEKGEINLTDLAQSEASLAGAQAKLAAAQNDLVTSKANFEKIIGKKVAENIQDVEFSNLWLPQSLAEARNISGEENPDLKIAILENEKAEQDVKIAKSDLIPSATLSYKIAEQEDFSSTIKERTQQTLKATATWPLYSGGSNLSGLRKAKELKNKYDLLLQDSKKATNTAVANAWSNYRSSKSVLDSTRSQVKAAEIANEGITLEYESGGSNRSTLEVIQSRSILLDSRINLAISERNFFVSKFNLLSAVGRLTGERLNLKQ
tara:strand:+ start:15 stop:1298 length:1284 start_codon:yes stop_codon:yes gene_type:complete